MNVIPRYKLFSYEGKERVRERNRAKRAVHHLPDWKANLRPVVNGCGAVCPMACNMSLSAFACRLSLDRIFFLEIILSAYNEPSVLASASKTRPNAPRPSSLRNLNDDSLVKDVRTLEVA